MNVQINWLEKLSVFKPGVFTFSFPFGASPPPRSFGAYDSLSLLRSAKRLSDLHGPVRT